MRIMRTYLRKNVFGEISGNSLIKGGSDTRSWITKHLQLITPWGNFTGGLVGKSENEVRWIWESLRESWPFVKTPIERIDSSIFVLLCKEHSHVLSTATQHPQDNNGLFILCGTSRFLILGASSRGVWTQWFMMWFFTDLRVSRICDVNRETLWSKMTTALQYSQPPLNGLKTPHRPHIR